MVEKSRITPRKLPKNFAFGSMEGIGREWLDVTLPYSRPYSQMGSFWEFSGG